MDPAIRPMVPGDAPAAVDVCMRVLFTMPTDLGEELVIGRQIARVEHLLGTDPGGSWIAEQDGALVGFAQAIVRERVWGLSLFAVDEAFQGRHLGRDLLDASLRHGTARDAAGWIVLSSESPAAMRRYALAGFDLHPTLAAVGIPDLSRAPDAVAQVEDTGPAGIALADEIGRELRGAGHGGDIAFSLERSGCRLLVLEDRAFVLARDANIVLLGARDPEAASVVLWAALTTSPPGATAIMTFATGAQQWAIRTALEARLPLSLDSPVCTLGTLGPLAPYLPSGAFL